MIIYIFNLLSIFLYEFFIPLYKNKKIMLTGVIGLQLFLFSSFRAETVGIDLHHYLPRFRLISDSSWSSLIYLGDIVDFEYGYILFNKIISIFINSERFFLIVTSGIIIFSLSKYIYNNSKIIWLSFFLFITMGFWGASLNIIRQFIAMAIIVHSLKYVKEKKIMKFGLYILLATFIHKSAISFILIYPISKIKITKNYIFLILGVYAFLKASSIYIIGYFMNLFNYNFYLDNIGNKSGNGSGMLIMLLIITIGGLIYRKNTPVLKKDYDLYLHLLFISIGLNILALDFPLMGRVMYYFTIHVIIFIPQIITSIRTNFDRRVALYVLCIFMLYYYFGIIIPSDANGVVPFLFM